MLWLFEQCVGEFKRRTKDIMNTKRWFFELAVLSVSILLQVGCATPYGEDTVLPGTSRHYDFNEYHSYEVKDLKIPSQIDVTGVLNKNILEVSIDAELEFPSSDRYVVISKGVKYDSFTDLVLEPAFGTLLSPILALMAFVPEHREEAFDFFVWGRCTTFGATNPVTVVSTVSKSSLTKPIRLSKRGGKPGCGVEDVKLSFFVDGKTNVSTCAKKHSRLKIDLKKEIESAIKAGRDEIVVSATASYPSRITGKKSLMNMSIDLAPNKHRYRQLSSVITADKPLKVYTGKSSTSLIYSGTTPYKVTAEGLDEELPARWVKIVEPISGATAVFPQNKSVTNLSLNILVKSPTVEFSCDHPEAVLRIKKGEDVKLFNLPYTYSAVRFENSETKEVYSPVKILVAVDGEYAQLKGDVFSENKAVIRQSTLKVNAKRSILDPNVLYQLGMAYYNGDSVSKNTDQASKFLAKAAQRGHSSAKHKYECLRIEEMAPRIRTLIREGARRARLQDALEFKGLYLGMKKRDAIDILNHYNGSPVNLDGGTTGASIMSDKNGSVTYIGIAPDLVKKMFKISRNMVASDFVQSFMDAYGVENMDGKWVDDGYYGRSSETWKRRDVRRGYSLTITGQFLIKLSAIQKSSALDMF